MSIPFRIRRAEWVAGAFLLLAVVALVASLVLSATLVFSEPGALVLEK